MTVAFIHKENFDDVKKEIHQITKQNPESKLIILNLMADVHLLAELHKEFRPALFSIVNLLCITGVERLRRKFQGMA